MVTGIFIGQTFNSVILNVIFCLYYLMCYNDQYYVFYCILYMYVSPLCGAWTK